MKIIEQPDPLGWNKQVTCSNCTSKLEVEILDLLRATEEGVDYLTFGCPVCKASNSLPLNFVPKHFHFALKRASSHAYDR